MDLDGISGCSMDVHPPKSTASGAFSLSQSEKTSGPVEFHSVTVAR
jgi:hypothetical protein